MAQSKEAVPGRSNVAPYVVRCVGESGRHFQIRGIFGSDWDAIDCALEQGAMFALPRRQRASTALRSGGRQRASYPVVDEVWHEDSDPAGRGHCGPREPQTAVSQDIPLPPVARCDAGHR
jgi:hypothetical protein